MEFLLDFLKFFTWTALWAFILSDSYARFIAPLIGRFYRILDEMAKETSADARLNQLYETMKANPDDLKTKHLYEMVKASSPSDGRVQYYFMKAIALSIEFVFAIGLAYALISWSTWCVLRCVMYTQGMESYRWVYFIPGFLCCEIALNKASKSVPYRNLLGLIPYIMAMGAFVVFALNYQPIHSTFSWLIEFVGLESL